MAGPETTSDKPNPEAAKSAASGGAQATSYVGSPAVGTSKAATAAGIAAIGPDDSQISAMMGIPMQCQMYERNSATPNGNRNIASGWSAIRISFL